MSERRFSMADAVRFGWETVKGNLGFFIVLLLAASLIQNLPGIIAGFAKKFPIISLTLFLAGWLLGFVVQMGLIKVSLKFCDGTKGKLDDLLSSFNLLLNFIAGTFLYGLIIMGGSLLLVIPGVIWAVKFSLTPYFIVDRNLGPIEALKASSKATEGAKWDLFLFGLLLGLINLAGALALVVGLFVTMPVTMLAYAHAYRTLAGGEKSPAESPETGDGEGPDELQDEGPVATQGEAPGAPAEEMDAAVPEESSGGVREKRPEKIHVTSSKGVMYINLGD